VQAVQNNTEVNVLHTT